MKTTIRLKTVILASLISWLGQMEVKAQIVTVVGDYPVIDLTALSPLRCTLTPAEANSRRTEMYTYTPTNDALLPVGLAVSGPNGTWNAKMSARFQVMRNNLGGTGTAKNWVDAWNGCKAYSGEGGAAGTWRLPTQRELFMIWALQPQLIGKGSFAGLDDTYGYWSSTENNGISAWYVLCTDGGSTSNSKTNACRARCVRDI